jgi:hypothetical protein
VPDSEDLAARLLFVVGHEALEVFGVPRIKLGEGQHLVGPRGVISEDHHAMQIVAIRRGGPLEADQGGELAGLVVAIRQFRQILPGRARASGR